MIECCPELQNILLDALEIMNFTILCGYRTDEAQAIVYRDGKSQFKPGQSKHNRLPAEAVDIAPYYPKDKIRWSDKEAACLLAGVIKACAAGREIKIIWGGDWDSDNDRQDQTFDDLWHFELAEKSII